jgi:hypothetical protein
MNTTTHDQLRKRVFINLSRNEYIALGRCELVLNHRGVTVQPSINHVAEILPWLEARRHLNYVCAWRGRWRGDDVIETDAGDARLRLRRPGVPDLTNVSDDAAWAWCDAYGSLWEKPELGDERHTEREHGQAC